MARIVDSDAVRQRRNLREIERAWDRTHPKDWRGERNRPRIRIATNEDQRKQK